MSAQDLRKAREKCYRLLAARSRTEQELRHRLADAGFAGDVTDEIILELKHKNLLNDEAYAGNWVRWRLTVKPVGREYLRKELKYKGIGSEIIDSVLIDYDHERELQNALTLARQRLERERGITWRRLAAFLHRRGFSTEIVAAVYRLLVEVER
ncbi:regulatory protein RecX [Desulfallas sp. Bu1-1]|jgi:regulatory protein|uniref:regulatory protein RecX n=1 Tax=Desulfallas sp. Bu1-1 TaxID=2787620 RepID=UPI00189FE7DD|nr:regulatory protein RecX [Desulfallas sp. Bu1-1]MBF7083046.1 regulatory protein RecX [Desulfallas sp. Bu1-1]